MSRLFLALDLPDELKQELVQLQPPRAGGIRVVSPDQLHVTLHFLGDAEVEPARAALKNVVATSFSLSFEGVGKFWKGRGPAILWAGVRYSTELKMLHTALADALRSIGFRPERRPYAAHITLARCEPGSSSGIVDEFLRQHAEWHFPAVPINEFTLYSSDLRADGPVYRREQVYPFGEATESPR